MFTVALVNSKPGTGKTTAAVWLAHAFMETGRAVILVDADPTTSLVEWSEMAGGFPFRALIPMPSRDIHRRLPNIARPGEIVVIDAPPVEDRQQIAESAMRAADELVIPVAPTPIEVHRTSPMLKIIASVNALRAEPVRASIMLNRTVAHANSTEEARDALAGLGFDVLAAPVPRLELFAQSFGNPVYATGTVWADIAAELLCREGITP